MMDRGFLLTSWAGYSTGTTPLMTPTAAARVPASAWPSCPSWPRPWERSWRPIRPWPTGEGHEWSSGFTRSTPEPSFPRRKQIGRAGPGDQDAEIVNHFGLCERNPLSSRDHLGGALEDRPHPGGGQKTGFHLDIGRTHLAARGHCERDRRGSHRRVGHGAEKPPLDDAGRIRKPFVSRH